MTDLQLKIACVIVSVLGIVACFWWVAKRNNERSGK